ncbi:MAG: hypothetical protein DSY90_02285 [Deltaproteobacteria bacterium]|nr:MAG: hypothetical protein DSY90_02285 [Deltaproteobacteria bacterium]
MKKFTVFLCAMMLVLGMVGSASALTWTDTYDPADIYMAGHWWGQDDLISWQFDLTDDGYDPSSMFITDAVIQLNLHDDGGWFDYYEWATLDLDFGTGGTQSFSWEVDTGTEIFTVGSIMTLSDTGLLDVTLTATSGDFYFDSATLTANGDAAPVPEPATILLMGAGLLGLVGFSRKRSGKKS